MAHQIMIRPICRSRALQPRIARRRYSQHTPSGDGATESTHAEWENVCFYITPIGSDGTEIRRHSDMLLRHLLSPACEAVGLTVIRADKIERSGLITKQVFEYLVRAKVCVTDMSYSNPNAFYELGIRHMTKLPSVQLIRVGDKIPFDVSQGRTIHIDTSDVYTIMDRLVSARKELEEHLRHILAPDYKAGEDNPVEVYMPGIKVALPRPQTP